MAEREEKLRTAAMEGKLEHIKEILTTGPINLVHWCGIALPAAVENGHVDVVEYLLEQGADTGFSINVASGAGSIEMVNMLLEHGASVEYKDADGKTPLHWACEKGQSKMVKMLVVKGAKIEAKDRNGKTPLHLACQIGDMDVVMELYRAGAKLKLKDRRGNTALHIASENGHTALVHWLLRRHASYHVWNDDREIPLDLACRRGHNDIVRVLLTYGNTSHELEYAFLVAIRKGFHKTVEILLDQDMMNYGRCKMNHLYTACKNGHLEVVNVLLQHELHHLGERGRFKETPLHIACYKGHAEIVKLLLRHGEKFAPFYVLWRDIRGYIPLHYARSSEVIRILLQHDVDVNTVDNEGKTALVYAGDDTKVCCTLLDHGAELGLAWGNRGSRKENPGASENNALYFNSVTSYWQITGKHCLKEGSRHLAVSQTLANSLKMHFIKANTARVPTSKHERAVGALLRSINYFTLEIKAYTVSCEEEVARMRTSIIANTRVTHYDLLARDPLELRDEAVLGNFNLKRVVELFPIYADMLHCRYLKFRKLFLKEQSRIFFGLTEPWLPLECAEQIIRYLPNQDLDTLLHVCYNS